MDDEFSRAYNDDSFWAKVTAFARIAGREVLEKALVMYFCLMDADTPAWARAVIIAALGYFIVPLDAIPDLTPAVGLADDLGALAAAFATVAMHVKPEHRARAEEKLRPWFG